MYNFQYNLGLTPEEQLLILLARQDIIEKISDDVHNIVNNYDVNWDTLHQLSLNQGVAPIIASNLEVLSQNDESITIPRDSMIKFKVVKMLTKRNNLLYFDEIKRLGKIFHQHNIKCVVLKGAALANNVYTNNKRSFNDIDLLFSRKDIFLADYILTKDGYKNQCEAFINCDDGVPTDIFKKLVEHTQHNVADYQKIHNDFRFSIDMHKTDEYNYADSYDLYNNALESAEGIYFSHLIDLFIYSCYHAWHHYPFPYAIESISLSKLKHFMDIRECYLLIVKNNLLNELSQRVKGSYLKYVINDMLFICERLYGKFCVYDDTINLQSTTRHDVVLKNFSSFFEHRLLRPIEEKRKLNEYKEKEDKKLQKKNFKKKGIDCRKIDTSSLQYFDKSIWKPIPKHYIRRDSIWSPLYGGTSINKTGKSATFSLAWDNNYFYLRFIIRDDCPIIGDDEGYNPNQNQVLLVFNKNWDSRYSIQLKKNGNHKIFKNLDRLWEITELNNYKVHAEFADRKYEIISMIPWSELGIEPELNMNIDFFFNLIIGEKRYLADDALCYPKINTDSINLVL